MYLLARLCLAYELVAPAAAPPGAVSTTFGAQGGGLYDIIISTIACSLFSLKIYRIIEALFRVAVPTLKPEPQHLPSIEKMHKKIGTGIGPNISKEEGL